MNALGTGLSGLVGSRVVELLSPEYSFTNFSLESGVDITNKDDITRRIVQDKGASWVLHMAAYTNVQEAEKDSQLGEQSVAWKVNVLATQYIVDACKSSGKQLLYIDTDYAFDGTRSQPYTEEDTPSPQGWYAKTKSEGAKRVLGLGDHGLVIRISNPYRAHPVGKKDFIHKILERLQVGQTVMAATDQLFVPTFIDDIALAVGLLLKQNAAGIYHVVSGTGISPFDAAQAIARNWECDISLVLPTTFAEYFMHRAPTPQYAVLSNKKITNLGVVMHDFLSGIQEVRRQESLGHAE